MYKILVADDEIKNLIPYVEDVASCNYGPCFFVDENGNLVTGYPFKLTVAGKKNWYNNSF